MKGAAKTKGRRFPFRLEVYSGYDLLHEPMCEEGYMAFLGVLHGKVRVRVGIHTLEAEAGEIIFIPPNSLCISEAASQYAAIRIMSFHRSILTENMDSLEQELLYMLSVQARSTCFRMRDDHPLHARLAAYMQTAEEEFLSKEPCYKLPIRATVYLMMTALLRYYSTEKKDGEHAVYHNIMRMKSVLDRIESDIEGRATVSELAEELLLSPDHFSRIFRESVGATPVEYINRVRIERALVLLARSDMKTEEVARSSGFSGTSYFYRLFKGLVGMSPAEFRRQYE